MLAQAAVPMTRLCHQMLSLRSSAQPSVRAPMKQRKVGHFHHYSCYQATKLPCFEAAFVAKSPAFYHHFSTVMQTCMPTWQWPYETQGLCRGFMGM